MGCSALASIASVPQETLGCPGKTFWLRGPGRDEPTGEWESGLDAASKFSRSSTASPVALGRTRSQPWPAGQLAQPRAALSIERYRAVWREDRGSEPDPPSLFARLHARSGGQWREHLRSRFPLLPLGSLQYTVRLPLGGGQAVATRGRVVRRYPPLRESLDTRNLRQIAAEVELDLF